MDFTIVTPSFKQLDWLELCIGSVADQEGVTLEHFIQDAGTEGFAEFAKRMAVRWPDRPGYRRVMVSEKDGGMYDAVNRGLKRGAAPVCAYLNCDEQYLPGALKKVLTFFEKTPPTEVLFAGVLIVSAQGELISARRPVHLRLPHVATCHLPNFTCAMFFRRSLLFSQKAWFDSRWRDCADALWVMDRLKKGSRLKKMEEFTTVFTDTGSNMNLSPNALREARAIRSQAPAFWKLVKGFWILQHWAGKLLGGAYWPASVEYALYTSASPNQRLHFARRAANPFWQARWFIRFRLSFRRFLSS